MITQNPPLWEEYLGVEHPTYGADVGRVISLHCGAGVIPDRYMDMVNRQTLVQFILDSTVIGTEHVKIPPFPFGRICFVVLVMRKGGESSWGGLWHLVCALEIFHVHSYQDQFIQPSWAEHVFCVFSLGLYFVFLWLVCVSPSFCVSLGSWVISLTVFGTRVTNLNDPPL